MARHRVVLSSIDQLMPTSYIRLFLVIRTTTTDFDSVTEQLQRGLERTQQQLPYIGGAVFETASGRIGIEWEEGGHPPLIQSMSLPSSFPSSTELEHAELSFGEVWRVEGPNGRFGGVEIKKGLPAIIITCSHLERFIILSVSCFHSLWDIAGLSVFLHLWSRNTKKSSDDVSPSILEDISRRDDRIRRSLRARDLMGSSSFKTNLQAFPASDAADIDSCTLQFDISKLKVMSGQLSSECGRGVSANDLAIAIIWTSISWIRFSSDRGSEAFPRLRVLVDGRKHVFEPKDLRAPFMGNLALPLFSSFNVSQDSKDGVPQDFVSLLIVAIKSILSTSDQASPNSFVEAISTLDETMDAASVRESSAVYNTKQLTSTSWSQAPMYVDFGARVGTVEYVRIAPDDYKLEGMILTLPRKREGKEGSQRLEIFVAMRANELQSLQESEVIQSFLAVPSSSYAHGSARAKM